MQKKESDKRLAFDPSDQSPVIQKDSPQRLTMQSRSGQSNGVRGSEEINESMSSLGISNVPNRTNK